MQRAGYDGRIQTLAVQRLVALGVPVDGGTLRRPALADDGGHLGGLFRIYEHERLAAKRIEILLDHPADEKRGHARVERIAALLEDFECGRGGEWVARRNAGVAP